MESKFISTGNDILNDMMCGGYETGNMYNIIGPSGSGKTFFAVEAIYHAIKEYGKKVKIRYADAESGFSFDTQKLYGYSLKDNMADNVDTIEHFMVDLGTFIEKVKDDEIGFYVVDSFDGLCSDADIEEYENRMKEHKKGKEYKKGSYDMGKQKFSSKLFRTMKKKIKNKNVVLFIISQLRDNINVTFGSKWTVSGGNALLFYADGRLFIRPCDKFKVKGLQIGYCAEVTGIKTRNPLPNRQCYVNILHDPECGGFDNVGSNIDYLFDLKDDLGKLIPGKANSIHWGENTKEVNKEALVEFLSKHDITEDDYKEQTEARRFTPSKVVEWITENPELKKGFVEEFGVIDRESLIAYIEENDLEDELTRKAKEKWFNIEESIRPKRKRKTL